MYKPQGLINTHVTGDCNLFSHANGVMFSGTACMLTCKLGPLPAS